MNYRIFWTCILPEHLIAEHALSFAACNFSFNLMSGGMFDKVYSSLPLYVSGEMQQEAFEDKRFKLIYDKWRKKEVCGVNWPHSKSSLPFLDKYPKDHLFLFGFII